MLYVYVHFVKYLRLRSTAFRLKSYHPSNEYLRKVFRLRAKDSCVRRNDSGGLCIPYRTVLFTLIGRKLRSDKLFQQVITG
jgi:hypothetical protein